MKTKIIETAEAFEFDGDGAQFILRVVTLFNRALNFYRESGALRAAIKEMGPDGSGRYVLRVEYEVVDSYEFQDQE